MSVSPTSSNVYVNFTSIFSQNGNGNRGFSAIQAAASSYSNGAFQIRSAKLTTLDVLDLSPEGLAASQQPSTAVTTPTTDAEETGAVDDVTLKTPEIDESQRVEMIRVNKNAVLARVKELFDEKGLDVSSDQAFELTTNFLDGSISVAGIEDPELLAAANEALAGDEELVELMRKTRDELGLPEQPNTVPRNFTIQYNSMEETPEGAEIDFHIDLFVNQPVPLLEDGTQQVEDGETAQTAENPSFHWSVTLSNKIKLDSTANLLNSVDTSVKKSDKKDKTDETDETDEEEETDETNAVAEQDSTDSDSTNEGLWSKVDSAFSAFGSFFQMSSSSVADENGLALNWNLQFSNWNVSDQSAEDATATQRIFQMMNIGGTTQFALDPTSESSPEDQAAALEAAFAQSMASLFSSGTTSPWSNDFLAQSGLLQMGF